MDFTTEQIKERLNVLVGQKNDHYEISKIIRTIFVEALEVPEKLIWGHFTWSTSNCYHQTLYFNWNGYRVVRIEYKKKKGDTHWSWYGGSSTDYTFKSFEVFFYDEAKTILEGIKRCNDLSAKSNQHEEKVYSLIKKIYKHIRDTFDEEIKESETSLWSVITELDRKQYQIMSDLKKEEEVK